MLTRGETIRAIAGGVSSLAGIALFAAAGVAALLATGLSQAASPLLDPYILGVLRFTLLQAVLSSALSVAVAVPLARAMARQPRFPGRIWILRLMGVPLGLPVIIGALGLIAVWGQHGWVNRLLVALGLDQPVSIYGLTGILLAHVFFNFPLATRLLLASLERLPGEYWLIASNLGMKPRTLFRLVEWPAMRSQIPAIAGLILMLAATSFTLVLLLGGGPAATTLEVAIYQALRFDFDPPRAVALALIQIGMTALILIVLQFFGGAASEGATLGRPPERPDGQTSAARLLDAGLILPATAFLLFPLAAVVISGLQADLLRLIADPKLHRAVLTSLLIALPAGLLAVLLAYSISSARFALQSRNGLPMAFERMANLTPALASLILLVPPTVLGTGWFLIAGPANMDRLAPFLIAGINGLMAFPFVLRVIDPALTSHRERTLRLCASLGITGLNRWRQVDWPGLKTPLLTAFTFAAALSLGDLGVVALFGSDQLVTLPWLLYSRMGSYRTDDAAGLALILGLLCLFLMVLGTTSRTPTERASR